MADVIDLDRRVDDDNTAETDRNLELKPDGSGGVVWERRYLEQHRQVYQYTDFFSAPGFGLRDHHVQGVVGSTGSVLGGSGLDAGDSADHPGVWQLNTGGAADGRSFIISGAFATFNLGSNRTRLGTWMRLGVAGLSTPGNRFWMRSGHGAVTLIDITFGVFFEYIDDENGGRWQALTVDGVGETSTDTGITVVADRWYKLESEVNAAGTSVEFFIDDVLVATNTTNIPVGDTYDHFVNIHILKETGTAGRNLFVDATYLQIEVNR